MTIFFIGQGDGFATVFYFVVNSINYRSVSFASISRLFSAGSAHTDQHEMLKIICNTIPVNYIRIMTVKN